MEIGLLNNQIFSNPNTLQETLAKKDPAALNASAALAVAAQPVQAAQADSLMARNFVSKTDDEQSKYVKATLAARKAESAQINRQNALLGAALEQVSGGSYADRTLAGKRAARSMMQEMQRSVSEASQRNLNEIKEAVESQGEENTAQEGQVVTTQAATPTTTAAVTTATPAEPSQPAAQEAPAAPSIDVVV